MARVWTVEEFHNCEDAGDCQGTLVIAAAANEQVAKQIASKTGGHVSSMEIRTNARSF